MKQDQPAIICPKNHDPVDCRQCDEFSSTCYHANQPRSNPKEEQARTCKTCGGKGVIYFDNHKPLEWYEPSNCEPCPDCNPDGQPRPDPVDSNPAATVETKSCDGCCNPLRHTGEHRTCMDLACHGYSRWMPASTVEEWPKGLQFNDAHTINMIKSRIERLERQMMEAGK